MTSGRMSGVSPDENEDVIVLGERALADHDGVSGAALLFLNDKTAAGVGHGLTNAIGLEADDGVDVLDGNDFRGSLNYPAKQRFAPDFVEHLGMLRFKACSLAGGHDGDSDTWLRSRSRRASRHRRDITGLRERDKRERTREVRGSGQSVIGSQ